MLLAEREVEYRLKPWIIAVAIIVPPIAFVLNTIMQSFTDWASWPGIFPLPWFLNLLILFLLEKASPKLRISPLNLVLLFTIMYLVAGQAYAEYGLLQWTLAPLPTFNQAIFVYAGATDPYREITRMLVPTPVRPPDSIIDSIYFGGPLSIEFIYSAIFWSIWVVVFIGGTYFWGYILRKPLVDVERLPFPGILPSAYMTMWYVERSKDKPKLFNLKSRVAKLFFVSFIIGFLISIQDAVRSFVLPTLPRGIIDFRTHELDITPMTRDFLPGAFTRVYLVPPDVLVLIFAPLDMLMTCLLWWLIFCIIYPVIGIRGGWLPYRVGIERYSYQYYGRLYGPFKFELFGLFGVVIGLGLWTLYNHRRYIIEVFKIGLGIEEGGGEDEGLSYRTMAIGALLFLVLGILLFSMANIPIHISAIAVLWYLLTMISWSRVVGESHEYLPAIHHHQKQIFDFLHYMGLWGPAPAQSILAYRTMIMYQSLGSGGLRMASIAMPHQLKLYRMASMSKVPAKLVFIISLITLISAAFSAEIIWPIWYSRFGGYSALGGLHSVYTEGGMRRTWELTFGRPPTTTSEERMMLTAGGIVLVFIIYLLRSRFAWFFINPVGIAVSWVTDWWWATIFLAFIIKYVVLRIGGARAYEEYLVPIAAGLLAGYGVGAIVSAFIAFFNIGLPSLLRRL